MKYLGFVICVLSIIFAYYFCFYDGFVSYSDSFKVSSEWLPKHGNSEYHHDPYVFILLFQDYNQFIPMLLSKIYALFLVLFPITTFYIGLKMFLSDKN